ncbi:nucleotide exchange factor GrpE, partial [Candidatus Pelagibacter sp.]|nr:nucleotide exchange factor GrpE [Candidatus Pelagibacter sp.]
LVAIVFVVLLCAVWLTFWSKKNYSNISDEIDDLNEETGSNLEILNKNVLGINDLLETYKKVIDEKNKELNKYREGGELLKHKGLFISLIDILDFINKFSSSSNNLDEKTKNYITAIHDKLDIVLTNSGVERFNPEINKNILEVNGCSPSIETKKTKDKNKVNLISSVIKPGYRLQTKENEFMVLKNSEVQVYELEN